MSLLSQAAAQANVQEFAIGKDHLIADAKTQARLKLDPATVDEYADLLRTCIEKGSPWPFPPIKVIRHTHRGAHFDYVWDGFHRIAAARRVDWPTPVPTLATPGTQRDAILAAVGANADHGLRRTNEDKRRAVTLLLMDAEWCQWSDRMIALQAKVTHPFVAKIRAELYPAPTSKTASTGNGYQSADKRVGRDGREISTSNIGSSPPAPERYANRRPIPPATDYKKWDGDKCPGCKKIDGRIWEPSKWQADECNQMIQELSELDSSWLDGKREDDRPRVRHPLAIQLQRHWSRFCTGRCSDCETQFWHDFGGEKELGWNYYAKIVAPLVDEAVLGTGQSRRDWGILATDWLAAYRGKNGETWEDLAETQIHHANSPCFQRFAQQHPDCRDPKTALRQALAVLSGQVVTTPAPAGPDSRPRLRKYLIHVEGMFSPTDEDDWADKAGNTHMSDLRRLVTLMIGELAE